MPRKKSQLKKPKTHKSPSDYETIWKKRFFEKEQLEFSKKHPMANYLISLFLIMVAIFVTLYVMENLEELALTWLA